jgi:hypothetical protein
MNGRTKISQFLVPAGRRTPRSLRQLRRYVPECALVFLSEGAADRVYGPAERAPLTRARSLADFLDGWLALETLLCAAVSVRAAETTQRGDVHLRATEPASPWPGAGEIDVRLEASQAGGEPVRLGVSLRVAPIGEAPRLLATIFMDDECPRDQ